MVLLNFFLGGFSQRGTWVLLNFFLKGFHRHTDTQMGIAKLLTECFQRDERWVLLSFLLEGFSHTER
jgi:hypothetical protein